MNDQNTLVAIEVLQDDDEPVPDHTLIKNWVSTSADWLCKHIAPGALSPNGTLTTALSMYQPCLQYERLKAFFQAFHASQPTSLSVNIVTPSVSQSLNAQYRQKDKPTNILSFPGLFNPHLHLCTLGDLVINAELTAQQAKEQHKTLSAHWAHLIVHGFLHLLGFDHEREEDATVMEGLEIELLHNLGFSNPYIENPPSNLVDSQFEGSPKNTLPTGSQPEAQP